jgi:hypothetical protein
MSVLLTDPAVNINTVSSVGAPYTITSEYMADGLPLSIHILNFLSSFAVWVYDTVVTPIIGVVHVTKLPDICSHVIV